MNKIYDIAIIGAGIAGVMVAFFAKQKGLKVIILDKSATVATGGSAAAGAFIAPKLGKSVSLVNLTNRAFKFANSFYSKYFSNAFYQSGVVRFAKDKSDLDNLENYIKIIGSGEIVTPKKLNQMGIKSEEKALFFKDGGVCDAQKLCKIASEDIDYLQLEVKNIENKIDYILLDKIIKAKKIIFATGYEAFENFDYMSISGLWGSRGDYYCEDDIKVCMHKGASVSSNIDGIIKIGATTLRDKNPCLVCNGEPLKNLEEVALKVANIKNFKIKEIFCGYRANSKDHFPIVGRVIDSEFMLEKYPQIKKGYKKAPIKYKEGWYVLNGLGARGFVFAPLMSKILIEHIINGKDILDEVNSERMFLKWARKLI